LIDSFLWRPVFEGFWKQRETFDGTYDFGDLLAFHEFSDANRENRKRYEEWKESQRSR
jgi:hypothetical protein